MDQSPAIIDIIIVNYNSTSCLLNCLKSIFNQVQAMAVTVTVVDNASEDEVERIREGFPQVRLSINSTNVGFSRGINSALRGLRAPYILILNPDTSLHAGFFGPLLEYMEEKKDVGILGPKILNVDGSLQASARSHPSPLTAFFGRSSLLSKWFPDNPITTQNLLALRSDGWTPMGVDWVSGACMLVRQKALKEVGPMDERFFMYWEDADWCRRMRERGWKVVYFPRSSIEHYVGVSSERRLFRSILQFHKSIYRLFEKYNSPVLWFLKPFVIGGLSLRLPFVVVSNEIRSWHAKGVSARIVATERSRLSRSSKIKVLRMIARLNIGGPSIHVHLLSKGLDKKRFESVLVTGKISPQEGDMGYLFESPEDPKPMIIPELQREISLRRDMEAFFHIYQILRQYKPDIVHTHTAKAGTTARFAALLYNRVSKKKVRLVHTFHGHVFDGYFSREKSRLFVWIEKLLARQTDIIVAISESQKRDLTEKYRVASADKVRTVPLGFDLTPFFLSERLKGQFRKTLGVDNGTKLVGIIGRLVPIKNHRMFIEAARIFLKENPGIPVKFIVVGDGEVRGELEEFCRQNSLSGHVRFCGWMKDLAPVYADLDVLALTSLNEGTPVSIIEAMASCVPVIATAAGGVLDLMGPPTDRVSPQGGFMTCERGILCRLNEPHGFSQGLKSLLEEDPRERRQRILRARAFVEQKFGEARLLKEMESLYLSLLNGDPRAARNWRQVHSEGPGE